MHVMNLALLLDLYELTMLSGYLRQGIQEQPAVFDLYFRENPFQGGYALFAGLAPALEYLESLRFGAGEISYLRGTGLFEEPFLDYLGRLRFRGRVTAMREGEVVFGGEPLITVEAALGEAQIVETTLLNLIGFQTLIATKAARMTRAAGGGDLVEFGARRSQGPDGALGASRAAFIGGARSTSNLGAGRQFGIPVAGTQAHSWVMAFDTELEAFRAYAAAFPDHCVLLVDTYDTLLSGLPNAIRVAREMRERGQALLGVRLDSGDLARLSAQARRLLDEAGFPEVQIVASNEVDERVIESVRREGGRVDQWGVGGRLVTGGGAGGGTLGTVYKLVELNGRPRVKVSSDRAKSTVPGSKKVWRVERDGGFDLDLVSAAEEAPAPGDSLHHPTLRIAPTSIGPDARVTDLRAVVMEGGRRTAAPASLESVAEFARQRLSRVPEACLRLLNPHVYQVLMTQRLQQERDHLIEEATRAHTG